MTLSLPRTLSYARVSSLGQVDGYSLPAQRERAADYARFRGWPTPFHFAAQGISGRRATLEPATRGCGGAQEGGHW